MFHYFHSSLEDYDSTDPFAWLGCSYANLTSCSTKGPKCPWKFNAVGGSHGALDGCCTPSLVSEQDIKSVLSQVIDTVLQGQRGAKKT